MRARSLDIAHRAPSVGVESHCCVPTACQIEAPAYCFRFFSIIHLSPSLVRPPGPGPGPGRPAPFPPERDAPCSTRRRDM
jgi:hypothetical protein